MKPILFSTKMVQAILEGRKTQTRRIIKSNSAALLFLNDGFTTEFILDKGNESIMPYKKGEILWVRETWGYNGESFMDAWPILYKADNHEKDPCKWRPSIHMPKDACRLYLKITNLRIERLQDITFADAIAEGIEFDSYWNGWIDYRPGYSGSVWGSEYPQESFKSLWESISGEASWHSNPFVWVIEFEIAKENK